MGFIVLKTHWKTSHLPREGKPVVVRITPNHYNSTRNHDVFSVWVPNPGGLCYCVPNEWQAQWISISSKFNCKCCDWIRVSSQKYALRAPGRKTWSTAEAAYEVVKELNRLEDWLDSKHT